MKVYNVFSTLFGFYAFSTYLDMTHFSVYIHVSPVAAVITAILGLIATYFFITLIQIKKPKELRRITNRMIIGGSLLAYGVPLLLDKHQIHDTKLAIIAIAIGFFMIRSYLKDRDKLVYYYNEIGRKVSE